MKILLADDSMTAQNMGKKILTEAGYEVVAVSNGAAAVKKIAEHRPDIAVLDVYMPGYTGLEVCERLKTAHDTTHMPVLLTVGRMEPFKPEEGNRVKADGIIIKPFEASDLLAAIQKIEQRLTPARAMVAAAPATDATTSYEKTQKIRIPYLEEFKDASYEEWKVSAPGHMEEGEQRATVQVLSSFNVPEAMQGSPALGVDELEIVPQTETEPQPITNAVDPAPTAKLRTGTTQIDPKNELAAALPASEATAGATKSISGVWKALDKAHDWFTGTPKTEPPPKPEEMAFLPVSDVPEQNAAKVPAPPGISEEIAHAAFEPEPGSFSIEPALEESPVTETVKTVHELAFEKTQTYGAIRMDSQLAAAELPGDLLEHTSAKPVEIIAEQDPHLDVAPKVELRSGEIAADPHFEPTLHARAEIPAIAPADPALVTDAGELASAFPTRFGVANPEDIPVGVASNYPQLYADSALEVEPDEALETIQPTEATDEHFSAAEPSLSAATMGAVAAAAKSSWMAEEAPLEAHENSLQLHDEMHQSFASEVAAAEEEPEVELIEPGTEIADESSEVVSAPDPELAAAMAAAVGAEVSPAVLHAVSLTVEAGSSQDEEKHTAFAADIVQRVIEMMKPELIKRIAAELGKKK